MAEAKSRAAWAHTSSLMALLANVNRDPKRHGPFRPADFDPHRTREKDVVIPHCDVEVLKRVFVDRKGGKP